VESAHEDGTLGRFMRTFYDARRTAGRTGQLNMLDPYIAPDVRWNIADDHAFWEHDTQREFAARGVTQAVSSTNLGSSTS